MRVRTIQVISGCPRLALALFHSPDWCGSVPRASRSMPTPAEPRTEEKRRKSKGEKSRGEVKDDEGKEERKREGRKIRARRGWRSPACLESWCTRLSRVTIDCRANWA